MKKILKLTIDLCSKFGQDTEVLIYTTVQKKNINYEFGGKVLIYRSLGTKRTISS